MDVSTFLYCNSFSFGITPSVALLKSAERMRILEKEVEMKRVKMVQSTRYLGQSGRVKGQDKDKTENVWEDT